MFFSRNVKTFNVVMHGLAFTGIFTAFQTSSFFESTLLDDVGLGGDLGFNSLAVIYAVFSMANFVSPFLVEKLGPRLGMGVGGSFYCLFIAALIEPKEWSVLGASALLGFGAAVLWTAQGNFLTINSDENTRGRNAGIFWAIFQSSILIGNLMAYFVLPDSSNISVDQARTFYLILFVVGCAGVLLLLPTRPVQQPPKDESLNTDPSESAKRQSLWRSIKSTFALLRTPDMLQLSFLIMYSGLENSFWGGTYFFNIGKVYFKPKDIGLAGILLGCSQIIGGLVLGRVADRYGKSWVVMIGLAVHMVSYYAIFINLLSGYMEPSLALALVCAFGLGLGDSCMNTAIYAMLSKKYVNQSMQAFAIFKFFQSALAGAAFAYGNHMSMQYQMLLLGISLIIGAFFYVRVDSPSRSGYQPLATK